MVRYLSALLLAAVPAFAAGSTPAIDESLSMKSVAGPQISPDGRYVAYIVNQTNWDDDEFVQQIWIAVPSTGQRYQLTAGKKNSNAPQWAPDSRRLAFLSDRDGKRQIYLIAPGGRRSRRAYQRGQRGRRHELVARWKRHRLHLHRAGRQGQKGSQGALRRFRNHRRRLRHDSPVARESARRPACGREAIAEGRSRSPREPISASPALPARPMASASPSAPRAIPISGRRIPSSSTCSTWRTCTCGNC